MNSGASDQPIREMFDRIARRYDLLNRVISFHLDTVWRRKAVKALALQGREKFLLDLGSGTGDLALAAARELGEKGIVVGLDFSLEMLKLAEIKKRRVPHGLKASYISGSALAPPFKDEAFDGIMTAFVLRNIPDLRLFFQHAYRLLKRGGRLVSLDMFPPATFPFSLFYSFYFYRLVPWMGALAGDRRAYQYLSDSVRGFAPPESIAGLIKNTGFSQVRIQKFLRGAVCMHVAEKQPSLKAA